MPSSRCLQSLISLWANLSYVCWSCSTSGIAASFFMGPRGARPSDRVTAEWLPALACRGDWEVAKHRDYPPWCRGRLSRRHPCRSDLGVLGDVPAHGGGGADGALVGLLLVVDLDASEVQGHVLR